MKTIAKITALVVFIAASSVFANSFEFKVGASTAKDPDKTGLDAAIGGNFGVNKFFTVGVEIGFQWISWEESTGAQVLYPTLSATEKIKYDAYNVPVMLNPRFLIPMGGNEFGGGAAFIPYVSLGIGYSFMTYTATYPDSYKEKDSSVYEDISETYSGLVAQPMVGVLIPLGGGGEFGGGDTGMKLMIEFGYRYNKVEKDSYDVDMSGFVVRAGTNFAF